MKRQHLLSSQEVVASTCIFFHPPHLCNFGEFWIGIGGCSFQLIALTAGGGVIVVGCSSTLDPAANLSIAGGI